jgi:Short C-terminal domain
MGYNGKTLFGLATMVAGVVAFAWCLYRLVKIGTCASGGPYVSARPCPKGTEYYGFAMFPAILAVIAGAGVFATRGGRAVKPGLPPSGDPTLSNPEPMGQAGVTHRPSPTSPAPAGGLVDLMAVTNASIAKAMGGPAPPGPGPAAESDDSLSRLERLAELKRAGVLSDAEFEAQKARVLRDG